MKRVLLISYYYPPMPAVGGLRARGLTKYLPEFGWEAVVLHGPLESKGGLVHRLFGIDPSQNMMAQAQELQRKVRVPIEWALRLYAEWFKYPDATPKGWYWDTEGWCRLPITDAIISTSSPVSCHLVARDLKGKLPRTKWIADFRDLWTQNHYYPYSRIRKHRERNLELETLATADTLTTVSEPLSEALSALHGKPVTTVLNGYDPEEVNDGSTSLTEHPTITYTGNIYEGRQSPAPLFGSMMLEGWEDEVRFYGPKQAWVDGLAREYRLDGQVRQYGVVSREEALQRQREAHRLLLLKWQGEQGIYTNKLFEYMAARRPILAVGEPDPYVDAVIEDINSGDLSRIEKYNQREMARKFAELLTSIT